jgi:hypothetical protein
MERLQAIRFEPLSVGSRPAVTAVTGARVHCERTASHWETAQLVVERGLRRSGCRRSTLAGYFPEAPHTMHNLQPERSGSPDPRRSLPDSPIRWNETTSRRRVNQRDARPSRKAVVASSQRDRIDSDSINNSCQAFSNLIKRQFGIAEPARAWTSGRVSASSEADPIKTGILMAE